MTVFVVTASHPYIPGDIVKIFATRALADAEAADICNIFAEDADLPETATAENWELVVEKIQKLGYSDVPGDFADAYINITEDRIIGEPKGTAHHAILEVLEALDVRAPTFLPLPNEFATITVDGKLLAQMRAALERGRAQQSCVADVTIRIDGGMAQEVTIHGAPCRVTIRDYDSTPDDGTADHIESVWSNLPGNQIPQ